MLQNESSSIASALLSKAAYERASGKAAATRLRPLAGPVSKVTPARSERVSREMKAAVLHKLHARSNAGLVSIRDVATALDQMLKGRSR